MATTFVVYQKFDGEIIWVFGRRSLQVAREIGLASTWICSTLFSATFPLQRASFPSNIFTVVVALDKKNVTIACRSMRSKMVQSAVSESSPILS